MNILFLTLYRIDSIQNNGIYEDLMREFLKHNHNVYIISPIERRFQTETTIHTEGNAHILELKTGNIQKTNILEKGISTLLIENQYISAIKKYFSHIKFDFVLYSTPPITLAGVVKYIKKRDNAKTYLLLKDIFPQNAVDIGMLSKTGIKSILYRHFRKKEKQLYSISDKIGCMSEANCEFVLRNNPDVSPDKIEVCPNAIEVRDMTLTSEERFEMRKKYNIPQDKTVFVYGGNLGKPQGIPFLIECLKAQRSNENIYFLIVGDGTEFLKLKHFFDEEKPSNMKLMKRLPKDDYDKMIASCDVGMIFLDHRFTIPNFPSRLLSYMQAKLPVLVCTDTNTDIGKIIVNNNFGWWCESNKVDAFNDIIENFDFDIIKEFGQQGYFYLNNHYTSKIAYQIILKEEENKSTSN